MFRTLFASLSLAVLLGGCSAITAITGGPSPTPAGQVAMADAGLVVLEYSAAAYAGQASCSQSGIVAGLKAADNIAYPVAVASFSTITQAEAEGAAQSPAVSTAGLSSSDLKAIALGGAVTAVQGELPNLTTLLSPAKTNCAPATATASTTVGSALLAALKISATVYSESQDAALIGDAMATCGCDPTATQLASLQADLPASHAALQGAVVSMRDFNLAEVR